MDTDKFDVMLDMADENFTADLMAALGVEPGDTVNIVTPTFDRIDHLAVQYIPKLPQEYDALHKMSEENLDKIGCQVWERENGTVHWLYPSEWYDHIPNGTKIMSICGRQETFEHGKTDDDRRFGALAYGFVQAVTASP